MIVILIYELAVADPHVPTPLYSPPHIITVLSGRDFISASPDLNL